MKVDTNDPDNVTTLRGEYDGTVTPDEVNLTWNIDDNDIDKVYIYRGTSRNFTVNTSSRIAINDDDDETYTDNNVNRSQTYYYKVVTRDEADNRSNVRVIRIDIPSVAQGTTATSTDQGTDTLPEGTVLGAETGDGGTPLTSEETTEGTSEEDGEVLGQEDIVAALEEDGLTIGQWILLVLALVALGYGGYVFYFKPKGPVV